jgi:copper oxidase (laccase) domain-containing protein
VLGPTISADAYEVGAEFRDRFVEVDAQSESYFTSSERAGHSYFDLPAYIVARLRSAGVGHAESVGLCTYADETRFFSFRRATHRGEPDYGRLLAAIALSET